LSRKAPILNHLVLKSEQELGEENCKENVHAFFD